MTKGLGRGLSSLLQIYDKEEKPSVLEEKTTKNTENAVKNDDFMTSANDLIAKYQKNTQPKEEEINQKWIKEKESLENKISKISQEMFPDTGAKQVAISRLQPNPDQPRKTFNQEALKELAQSIKEHGVIQPVIAVARGENYIIIAGERRYRASKMAGLKTMPVIVREYTDQQMREIALIENLQREDLNPIETAMAIKQLIDNYNFTQDELAQKLGKSRPVIANTIRLLSLEPEVLTLVEKGKLAPAIARAIITLPRDEQIVLAKKASDDKMTARDVEKTVHDILNPENSNSAKKSNPLGLELLSLRDDMRQVFGTKVTILGNNKKGRIYIDYYNKDDIDRIFNLINSLK